MNQQPTLVQELETAKILQQLSRREFDGKGNTSTTISQHKKITKPVFSLKRKRCVTESTPFTIIRGRPVSPGTDMESVGENSSCAGISLSEEKLKPLSAPPKLRRVSFGQTPRPTTSLNRVHPSPNKKTGTYSYLAMPVVASSECSIPIATPNLSNNMILQLMSNPLVFPGKIIPICQPVGTTPINQFQGSINIQSKAPLSIAPALCKPSNEILDSPGTKKRKLCRMDDCNEEAARRTPYCKDHCGQRKCEFTGCKKFAQGRTRFCIGKTLALSPPLNLLPFTISLSEIP